MKKEERKKFVGQILKQCLVDPTTKFNLSDYSSEWEASDEIRRLSEKKLKKTAKNILDDNLDELSDAQELLYATGTHSMLLTQ